MNNIANPVYFLSLFQNSTFVRSTQKFNKDEASGAEKLWTSLQKGNTAVIHIVEDSEES